MKLTDRSSIKDVAAAVAEALAGAGLRAVLSGGACASIYSGGVYQSVDLDFILQGRASPRQLDEAMAGVGFYRRGNQYFHPKARFYVEFPPGPLSIGSDYKIEPVEMRLSGRTLLCLSATDSCRDRLAGFFHWNDRPGLRAAIQIILRSDVDLKKIRIWSEAEGATARFEAFLAELEIARRRRERRRSFHARTSKKRARR